MPSLALRFVGFTLLLIRAASFVPVNFRGTWSAGGFGRSALIRAAESTDDTSDEDLAAANEALRVKVLELEAEASAAKEAAAKAEASAKVAVESMQGEAVAGGVTADSYQAM